MTSYNEIHKIARMRSKYQKYEARMTQENSSHNYEVCRQLDIIIPKFELVVRVEHDIY